MMFLFCFVLAAKELLSTIIRIVSSRCSQDLESAIASAVKEAFIRSGIRLPEDVEEPPKSPELQEGKAADDESGSQLDTTEGKQEVSTGRSSKDGTSGGTQNSSEARKGNDKPSDDASTTSNGRKSTSTASVAAGRPSDGAKAALAAIPPRPVLTAQSIGESMKALVAEAPQLHLPMLPKPFEWLFRAVSSGEAAKDDVPQEDASYQYWSRALARVQDHHFGAAAADLNAAATLSSNNSALLHFRGMVSHTLHQAVVFSFLLPQVYLQDSRFALAIEDFSAAVKVNPAQLVSYYLRAKCFLRLGLLRKAHADVRHILRQLLNIQGRAFAAIYTICKTICATFTSLFSQ